MENFSWYFFYFKLKAGQMLDLSARQCVNLIAASQAAFNCRRNLARHGNAPDTRIKKRVVDFGDIKLPLFRGKAVLELDVFR